MKVSSLLSSILRSLLAIFVGILVFVLIVMPYGIILESVFPGSLGEDNLPATFPSQLLLIVINFIGGSIGTLVVSLMAPSQINLHAVIFGILLLVFNLSALFGTAHTWSLWMSVVMLTVLPLEVWSGAWLANYIREE